MIALVALAAWGASTVCAEDDEAEAQPAEAPAAEDAASPELTLAAGGGAMQRIVEFAAAQGPERLNTGWVPALGVELRASFPSDSLVFGVEGQYATSLNAQGAQRAPSPESAPQLTAMRSHRLLIGARGGVQLGDARGVLVAALLGWGFHALASVAELEVPRFTLHGPLLRLELELPVVPERVLLRLAPHGELIVSVTKELRRLAETESHGYALGGEASLSVRIWDWLTAELQYHESHALLQGTPSSDLTDMERYLLVSARLQL